MTATALDGVNRVPGLIRNCGGDATDEPTSQPLHDFTCTDAAELVAFTPHYGAQHARPAPAGRWSSTTGSCRPCRRAGARP